MKIRFQEFAGGRGLPDAHVSNLWDRTIMVKHSNPLSSFRMDGRSSRKIIPHDDALLGKNTLIGGRNVAWKVERDEEFVIHRR
uniref:Uncharacterized protein n=1 Tax=Onchocerca volvulus TaxID=6282 RepID=A0A8R1Y4V9_ONCVO